MYPHYGWLIEDQKTIISAVSGLQTFLLPIIPTLTSCISYIYKPSCHKIFKFQKPTIRTQITPTPLLLPKTASVGNMNYGLFPTYTQLVHA